MSQNRLNWTLTGDPNQPGPAGSVRSITADDINMVFQPIVDVATGQLFAHEALVRCSLPQYATPQLLFLAAEKEHACGHLGRVIRQQVFERCQDTPLFVNVHPEELSQRWLVRPDDPLYFHEREVYLEITESAAFTHYDLCMSVLRDVCARTGVHLVVDDYGAGHSNLARILDLNPKVVKLDGVLIRGIDKDKRRQAILRHMVRLCIDLGALVVAECVETVEELQAVADQGVQLAQGYVLARPAYPPPPFTFALPGRVPVSSAARPRPPPKPVKAAAEDRSGPRASPAPGVATVPAPAATERAPLTRPSTKEGVQSSAKRAARGTTPPAAAPAKPPPLVPRRR